MAEIRHRVGVKAPASQVYEAVATREGLIRWWTRDVAGDSHPGKTLAFGFGGPEPAAVMEVTDMTQPKAVSWRCIKGPKEWEGTTVSFEILNSGDETALIFTHAGWKAPGEFLHHCSTKWAYFLLGLKAGLEGGSFTPWPHDAPISSWG